MGLFLREISSGKEPRRGSDLPVGRQAPWVPSPRFLEVTPQRVRLSPVTEDEPKENFAATRLVFFEADYDGQQAALELLRLTGQLSAVLQ